MSGDRRQRAVTGPLGLVGMTGGALFVGVYLALALVGEDMYSTTFVFFVVSAIPVLFWVGGTVGLFVHHRRSFEWPGRVGTVVLLFGLFMSIVDSLWFVLAGGPLLTETQQWGYILVQILGALLLGSAIVRARELPHAVSGGMLFALGLPVSVVLVILLVEVLDVLASAFLASAIFTIPFGVAWLVLGYDLFTEQDRSDATTSEAKAGIE